MFIKKLKAYIRRTLLIMAYVGFSLLLLFYPTQGINKKLIFQNLVPKGQVINKVSSGLPVRLAIPAINVNAAIQLLGVTQAGEMEVPSNAFDVGWFELGPRPGERGSPVIAGHFNGENGQAGIFYNLYKLNKGDKLYIENDKGISITFIVREKRFYDPGYADDVFSSGEGAHLNLVTCDGVWDGVKKSYNKRLVVFADIAY